VDVDGKRLRLRSAIAVSVVVALAGPSTAAAATCMPDQTVAVLDQYCETPLSLIGVPAPSDAKRGAAKSLSVALPPAEASRLRKAGPAAKALLLLPVIAPLPGAGVPPQERRRTAVKARRVLKSGQLEKRESETRSLAQGVAAAAGEVLDGAFRWGLVICSFGLAAMSWLRLRARHRL
jgi:hypothetical protein